MGNLNAENPSADLNNNPVSDTVENPNLYASASGKTSSDGVVTPSNQAGKVISSHKIPSGATAIASEAQLKSFIGGSATYGYLTADFAVGTGDTDELGSSQTLDGNGHTITFTGSGNWGRIGNKVNYTSGGYDLDGTAYLQGLLMPINNGTICNLNIKVGGTYKVNNGSGSIDVIMGTFAAVNAGTIENCTCEIIKSALIMVHSDDSNKPDTTADAMFGGIATVNAGTIAYCQTINNAKGVNENVTGVEVNVTKRALFGGISANNLGTIRNSIFSGDGSISNKGNNTDSLAGIGGIAGQNSGTIEMCHNGYTGTYLIANGSKPVGLIVGRNSSTSAVGWTVSTTGTLSRVTSAELGNGTDIAYTSVTGMVGNGSTDPTSMSGGAVKFGEITDSYVYYDYWGQSEKLYIGFYDAAALSDIAEVNMDHDTTNQLLSKKFTDSSTFLSGSDSSYLGASGITYKNSYEYNLGYGSVAATHKLGQTTMVTTGTKIDSSTMFPLTGNTNYYLTEDVYVDLYTNYGKDRTGFFNGTINGNGYSIYFYTSSNVAITDASITEVGNATNNDYNGIITNFIGTGSSIHGTIKNVGFVFLPNTNFSVTAASANAYHGIVTGGFQTNDDNVVDNIKVDIQDGANITFGGTSGNSYFGIVMGGIYGGGTRGRLENIWINLDGTINVAQNPSNSIFAGGLFGYMKGSNAINQGNGKYILSGSGKFRSTTTIDHTWTNVGIFGGVIDGSDYTLNTADTPLEILLWDWAWSMNQDDSGSSRGGVIKFVGGMNDVSAYSARQWCNQANVYSINVSYTNANGAYTSSGPVAQGVGSASGALAGSTLSTYSDYSIYQALGVEVPVGSSQKAPDTDNSMSSYQATAYVDFAVEFSTISNGYSNRATYKTSYQPNTGYGYASDGKTVQQLAVLTPNNIKTTWIKSWTGSAQSVTYSDITLTSLAPISLLKEYYGGTAAEAVEAYYTAVNGNNVPAGLSTKLTKLNSIATLSSVGYTLSNNSGTNVGSYTASASITSSYNIAMSTESFARLYILPANITVSGAAHAVWKPDNGTTDYTAKTDSTTLVNSDSSHSTFAKITTSSNIGDINIRFSGSAANAEHGVSSTTLLSQKSAYTISIEVSNVEMLGNTYYVVNNGYNIANQGTYNSSTGYYTVTGINGYIHAYYVENGSGGGQEIAVYVPYGNSMHDFYMVDALYIKGNQAVAGGGSYTTAYQELQTFRSILKLANNASTDGYTISGGNFTGDFNGVPNAGTYTIGLPENQSDNVTHYMDNYYYNTLSAGPVSFTLTVEKQKVKAVAGSETYTYGDAYSEGTALFVAGSGYMYDGGMIMSATDAVNAGYIDYSLSSSTPASYSNAGYLKVLRNASDAVIPYNIIATPTATFKANHILVNYNTTTRIETLIGEGNGAPSYMSGGTITINPKPVAARRQVKNTYYMGDTTLTPDLYANWIGVKGLVAGDSLSSGMTIQKVVNGVVQTALAPTDSITEKGFYIVTASDPTGADGDNYSVSSSSLSSFTVYVSDGSGRTEIAWVGESGNITVNEGYITDAGNVILGYTIINGYKISSAGDLTTFLNNNNYKYGYLTADFSVTNNISNITLASDRTLDGNGHTITNTGSLSWALWANTTVVSSISGVSGTSVLQGGLLARNQGTIKNLKMVYTGTINSSTIGSYNNTAYNTMNSIAGLMVAVNEGTIENCSVTLSKTATIAFHTEARNSSHDSGVYMGGIAGVNLGSNANVSYCTVVNNAALWEVNSQDQAVLGGVVGVNNDGYIGYCIIDGNGLMHSGNEGDDDYGTTTEGHSSALGGILGIGSQSDNIAYGRWTLAGGTVEMVHNDYIGTYKTSGGTNGARGIGLIAGYYVFTEVFGWTAYHITGSMLKASATAQDTDAYDFLGITRMVGVGSTSNNSLRGGVLYFAKSVEYDLYYDYWGKSEEVYVQFANGASISVTGKNGLVFDSTNKVLHMPRTSSNNNVTSFATLSYYNGASGNYLGADTISYSGYAAAFGFGTPAATATLTSNNNLFGSSGTRITASTTFPLDGSGDLYLLEDVYIDLRTNYDTSQGEASFTGHLYGNGHTIYFTTEGEAVTRSRDVENYIGIVTDYLAGGHIQDVTFAFKNCKFTMRNSNTNNNVAGLIIGQLNHTAQTTFYNVKIDIQADSDLTISTARTSDSYNTAIVFGRVANRWNTSNIGNIWINHDGLLTIDGCNKMRFAPLYGYTDGNTFLSSSGSYYVLSGNGTVKASRATGESNKDNDHFFGTFAGFGDDNYETDGYDNGYRVIYWNWGWTYENTGYKRGGGARDGWTFAQSVTAYFINCTTSDLGSGTYQGQFSPNTYNATSISNSSATTAFQGLNVNQILGGQGISNDENGVYSSIYTPYTDVTSGYTAANVGYLARYQQIGYVIEGSTAATKMVKMKSTIINADNARAGYQYNSTGINLITSDFLNVSNAWLNVLVKQYNTNAQDAYVQYLNGLGSEDMTAYQKAYDLYLLAQSLSFGMDTVFPTSNQPDFSYSGALSMGQALKPSTVSLNPLYNVGGYTVLGQFYIIPHIYDGNIIHKQYDGTATTSITIDSKSINLTYATAGTKTAQTDANANAFVRLTSQPADWSTNFRSYYTLSNGKYTPITGASAPAFNSADRYAYDGLLTGQAAYDLIVPTYHYYNENFKYYDEEGIYYDSFSFYAFDFNGQGTNNSAPITVAGIWDDPTDGSYMVLHSNAYISQRTVTATIDTKSGQATSHNKWYDTESGNSLSQVYNFLSGREQLGSTAPTSDELNKVYGAVSISGAVTGETLKMDFDYAVGDANYQAPNFVVAPGSEEILDPYAVGAYTVYYDLSSENIVVNDGNGNADNYRIVAENITYTHTFTYHIKAVPVYVPTHEVGSQYREYTAGKQHFAAPDADGVKIVETYLSRDTNGNYVGKIATDNWDKFGEPNISRGRILDNLVEEACGGDGGQGLAVAYVYVGQGEAAGPTFVTEDWGTYIDNNPSASYADFAASNAGFGAISTDGAVNVGEYVYYGYTTATNFYAPTDVYATLTNRATYAGIAFATARTNGRSTTDFIANTSSWEELAELTGDYRLTNEKFTGDKIQYLSESLQMLATEGIANYNKYGTADDTNNPYDMFKRAYITVASVSIYAEDQAIEYGQNLKDETILDNKAYIISQLPENMSMDLFKETLDQNGFKFAVKKSYIENHSSEGAEIRNQNQANEFWILPVRFDDEGNMTAWRLAIESAEYIDYNLDLTIISGNLTVYQKEITVEWEYDTDDSGYDATRKAYVYDSTKRYSISKVKDIYGVIPGDNKPVHEIKNIVYATEVGVHTGVYVEFNRNQSTGHWKNYYYGDGVTGSFEIVPYQVNALSFDIYVAGSSTPLTDKIPEVAFNSNTQFELRIESDNADYRQAIYNGIDGHAWITIGNEGSTNVIKIDDWTITLKSSYVSLVGYANLNQIGGSDVRVAVGAGISRFDSGNYTFFNVDAGNYESNGNTLSSVRWINKDVSYGANASGRGSFSQTKSVTYKGTSRRTSTYSTANADWGTDSSSYSGVIDLNTSNNTYEFDSAAKYDALGESLMLSDHTNNKNGVRQRAHDYGNGEYGMEFYYHKSDSDYGLTNALVWMNLTSSDPVVAEKLRTGEYYFSVKGVFWTRSEFRISSWWFTPAYISTTAYGIEDPYAQDYATCINQTNSYQLARYTPEYYGWESNDKDLYSSTSGWVEFTNYGAASKQELINTKGLKGYTSYRVCFMISCTNKSGTMPYGLVDAALYDLTVDLCTDGTGESVTDNVVIDNSDYHNQALWQDAHRLDDGNIEFELTSSTNSSGLQYGIDLSKINMVMNSNSSYNGDSRNLTIENGGLVLVDTTYKRTPTGKMILSSAKLKTNFGLFGRAVKRDGSAGSLADYSCSGYYFDKLVYVSDNTNPRNTSTQYYIDTTAPEIYIADVENAQYERGDDQYFASGALYGGWTIEGTKYVTIRATESFVAATASNGSPSNQIAQSGLARFEYSTSAGFEAGLTRIAAIENGSATLSLVINADTYYYFKATDAAGNSVIKTLYYNTNDRASDLNLTIVGSPSELEDSELPTINDRDAIEDFYTYANALNKYTENTWTNKNVLMRLAGFGEGNSLSRIYYRRIYTSREVDRTVAETGATYVSISNARQLKLWLYGYDYAAIGNTYPTKAELDANYKLSTASEEYKNAVLTTDIDLSATAVMLKIFTDVERLVGNPNDKLNTYPSLGNVNFTVGGVTYTYADGQALHKGAQGTVRFTQHGKDVVVNLNTQTIEIIDYTNDTSNKYYYGASAVALELAKGRVLDGGNYTITLQSGYWMGTTGNHNGVTLVNRVQDSNAVVLSSMERTIVTGSFLAYNNGTIKNIKFKLDDDMYIRATQNTAFGLVAGVNNGTIYNTHVEIAAPSGDSALDNTQTETTYNVHTFGLDFNQTVLAGIVTAVNQGYIAGSSIEINGAAAVAMRPNVDVAKAVGEGNWDVVNENGETDFVYGGFAAVNSAGVIENNTLTKDGDVSLKAVDSQISTIALNADHANYAYAGILVGITNTAVANYDLIRELNIVVKGNPYTNLPVANNTVNGTGYYFVTVEDTNYDPLDVDRLVIDKGNFKGVGIAVAYTADDINYGWIALETEEYGELLVIDHKHNWIFEDNGVYSLEIKIESGTGIDRYIVEESNGGYYYNTGEIKPSGITVEAIEVEENQISTHDNVTTYNYDASTSTLASGKQGITISSTLGQKARFKFSENDYADISVHFDGDDSDDTYGLYYIVTMYSAVKNGVQAATKFYVYPEKYEGKTFVQREGDTDPIGTVVGSGYDVTTAYVNGRGFSFDWTGWIEGNTAYATLNDTIILSLAGSEFGTDIKVGRFNVKIDKRTYNIAFRTEVDIAGVTGVTQGYQRVEENINDYIDYKITDSGNNETDFSNTFDENNHNDKYFVLWDNGTPATYHKEDSAWTYQYVDDDDANVHGWRLVNKYIANEEEAADYYDVGTPATESMTIEFSGITAYLLKSYQFETSTENNDDTWATIDLNTIMNGDIWYGIESIDTHMLGDQETKLSNFNGTEWVMTEVGEGDTALNWHRKAAINVQDSSLDDEIMRDVNLIVTVKIKYYASYNITIKDKTEIISEYGTASGLTYMYIDHTQAAGDKQPDGVLNAENTFSIAGTNYTLAADEVLKDGVAVGEHYQEYSGFTITNNGLTNTYIYYDRDNDGLNEIFIDDDSQVWFSHGNGTALDAMHAQQAEFYAVDLTADGLFYNTSSYQTYQSVTSNNVTTYKTDKLLVAKGVRNITDFYEIDIYDIAEELQVNTLTPAGDHHIVLKSATLGANARNYILNFQVKDYYTVERASINVDIDDNFGKLYDGTPEWTDSLNMVLEGGADSELYLTDYTIDQIGFYYKGDTTPTKADANKIGDMNTGRYLTMVFDSAAVGADIVSYAALNATEAPRDWATAENKYYTLSGSAYLDVTGTTFNSNANYFIKQKAGTVLTSVEGSVTSFKAHGYTFTVDGSNVLYNGVVRGTLSSMTATVYTQAVDIDYGYFMVSAGDHDVATPNVGGSLKLFLEPNSSYRFDTTKSSNNYLVSEDLPVYTGASLVVAEMTKTGNAAYKENGDLDWVSITYRHNDYKLTATKQADGSYNLMLGDSRRAVYSNGIIEFVHIDNPLYGQTYYLESGAEFIYKETEGWSSVQLSSQYAKLYQRPIYVQGSAGSDDTKIASVVFNGAAQATSAATGIMEIADYDELLAAYTAGNLSLAPELARLDSPLVKGYIGTLVGENAMFNASTSGVSKDKPILAGTYEIEYDPSTMTTENVAVSTIESTNAAVNTNSLAGNYYIAGVIHTQSDHSYKTRFSITVAESMLSVNRVVSEDGDRYVILITVSGLNTNWDGLSFINATNTFTIDGSDSFIDAMTLLRSNNGYYDFSVETAENKALLEQYYSYIEKDKNDPRAAEILEKLETSTEYLWQKAVGTVFRVAINRQATVDSTGYAEIQPSITSDTFGNFHFDVKTGKFTFEYYGNRNLDANYVSDRYSIKIAGLAEASTGKPGSDLNNVDIVNSTNVDTTKSALADGQISIEDYVNETTQTVVDNRTEYTFISTAAELLAWLKLSDTADGYENGVLTTNIVGFDWSMVGTVGGAQLGLDSGRTLDGNGYSIELSGDQISALEDYTMHLVDWTSLGSGYIAIETHGTAVMLGGVFVQYIAAGAQIKNVNFVYTGNRYYIHDENIGQKNLALGIIAGVALTNGSKAALSNVSLEIRGRFGYRKTGGMNDSMVLAFGGMVGIAAGTAKTQRVMENCSIYYYKTSKAVIDDMDDYDLFLQVDEAQGEHIMYGGFIGELNFATVYNVSVRTETNSEGQKSKLYAGVTNGGGWLFIGGGIGASRNAYAGKIDGYINKFDAEIKVINNKTSGGETYIGSIAGNVDSTTDATFSDVYSYYSSYTTVTPTKTNGDAVAATPRIGITGSSNANFITFTNSLDLSIYGNDPGLVDYYFGSNNYDIKVLAEDGKSTVQNYTSTVFINDSTVVYDPYSTGWTADTIVYSSYLREAEYQIGTIDTTLTQASGAFTINGEAYTYTNATAGNTANTWSFEKGDTTFIVDNNSFTIKNTTSGSTFYYGRPAEKVDVLPAATVEALDERINIEVLAPSGYFIWDYHQANYTNTLTDQGAATRLVWNIPKGQAFGNNNASTAGTTTTYYKYDTTDTTNDINAAQADGSKLYWQNDSAWTRAWNKPVLGTYSISTTDAGTTVFNYEYTGKPIEDTISVNVHISYVDQSTNQFVNEVYTASIKPTADMIDVGAYPIGDAIGSTAGASGTGSTDIASRVKVLDGNVSGGQIMLVISPKELIYTDDVTKLYDASTGYLDTELLTDEGDNNLDLSLRLTYNSAEVNAANKASSTAVVKTAYKDANGNLLSLIPSAVEEEYATDLIVNADNTIYYNGTHTTYSYEGTTLYDGFGYAVGTVTYTGDTLTQGSLTKININKVYEFRKISYTDGTDNDNKYLDVNDTIPDTTSVAAITDFYYAYLQVATMDRFPNKTIPANVTGVETVYILNMTMTKNEDKQDKSTNGYLVAAVALEGSKAYNYAVYGTTVKLSKNGDVLTKYTVNGREENLTSVVIGSATYYAFEVKTKGADSNWFGYNVNTGLVYTLTKSGSNYSLTDSNAPAVGHMYVKDGEEYINLYDNYLNGTGDKVWVGATESTLTALFADGAALAGKEYMVEAAIEKREIAVQYNNLLQMVEAYIDNGTTKYRPVDYQAPNGSILGIYANDGTKVLIKDIDAASLGLDYLYGTSTVDINAALLTFKAAFENKMTISLTNIPETLVFNSAYTSVELTASLVAVGANTGYNNFTIHVVGPGAVAGQIVDTTTPYLVFSYFAGETDENGEVVLVSENSEMQALAIETQEQFDAFTNLQAADTALTAFNFALVSNIDMTGYELSTSMWGSKANVEFDGNGYTISNIFLYEDAADSTVGLFSSNAAISVKNLTLTNIDVSAASNKIDLFGGTGNKFDNVVVQGTYWKFTASDTFVTENSGVKYELLVEDYSTNGKTYYIGDVSKALSGMTEDDPEYARYKAVVATVLANKSLNIIDGKDGTTAANAIGISNYLQLQEALKLPTLYFKLKGNIRIPYGEGTWTTLNIIFEKNATARTVKIETGNYRVTVDGEDTGNAIYNSLFSPAKT